MFFCLRTSDALRQSLSLQEIEGIVSEIEREKEQGKSPTDTQRHSTNFTFFSQMQNGREADWRPQLAHRPSCRRGYKASLDRHHSYRLYRLSHVVQSSVFLLRAELGAGLTVNLEAFFRRHPFSAPTSSDTTKVKNKVTQLASPDTQFTRQV